MKKEKVCQKWSAVCSHGYAYYLPENSIAKMLSTKNFIASFDQYAVPSLFITRYFAPLIL